MSASVTFANISLNLVLLALSASACCKTWYSGALGDYSQMMGLILHANSHASATTDETHFIQLVHYKKLNIS